MDMKNATIREVLYEIEESSEFFFLYSNKLIDVDRRVNISVKNKQVEEVLDHIFKEQKVTYSIMDRQVIIHPEGMVPGRSGNIFQQTQRAVSGKVTDTGGQPLPGVTVVIKGSTQGTVTNANGEYSLNNIPDGVTLVFSFVGMRTQEVVVGTQAKVNVVMKEETIGIEEVVAVGYGTQRRSLVTNAISSVGIDDENMRNVLSPTQLLQGRAAGVTTSTGSGNLGAAERVSIRGMASISASNEPLYVIDGIPINNTNAQIYNFGESMSSLASFNLRDIESIEILKDAASAAIYGSRANNGVILITTRSGQKGRSDIKLNVSYGISQWADRDKIDLVDSRMFVEQYNEGVANYNEQYGLQIGDASYKRPIMNPFNGLPDTDWLSTITQLGKSYIVDGAFSGGTEKTIFYVSGAYTNQEGIIKTNSIEKINFNAKISHEMNSWLEVGANSSANYIKNNQIPGANLGTTILARAMEQRPFDRPYKPNGGYYVGGTEEMLRHNPVQILNEQTAYLDQFRFLGNYFALFKFKENWTLRSSINADLNYVYDYVYYNEVHPYGTGVGRLIDGKRFVTNMLYENVMNYNKTFGDWYFAGMLGHSFQKVSANTSSIDGRGFPSPAFHVIGVASEIAGASGSISEYAMESYFGRLTSSYKDKYILNATLRTDGSSKFAPDTRYGWFPSVSLGWNISEEDFMASSSADLKFRISYGRTGNQDGISNYAFQPLMAGGQNYGNVSGIAVTSFGNNDLTWEVADQYDVGFDLAFLKGKINMMFDAYIKNTNNLLYSRPVHATTGVTSITSNIGSMQNKGLEFTLNTHFNLGPVRWNSQFNISTNKNEITSLLEDDAPISIGGNRALQVGKELGSFYLFVQDGIYQYDGEVPQPQYDIGIRAGDVKWTDVDGNGIINDNDRMVVSSSNPDFSGGWNNSFNYEGFRLDVFTSFMYGNEVYAQWKSDWNGRIGNHYNPVVELWENRWTGPGTTNKYPRALHGDINNHRNSDRWLEDGSFIRLRTLTLSYNFSNELLRNLGMSSLRVYCQADNLFLLTKYSGYDPEVSQNLDPRYFGHDRYVVPQPRTISVGANIKF
ncbi:SusC/RagA family TonB-linked outer membrane protein [Mariniphaga sediminis]|uniref:SusC/RagA family TonB-linked outer membrane protein n=1 Tax=Mariniphaga sediminis TaxID=1628158 RepID=A0A399DBA8_9BACT|nr:SusC/RagA family TonB-linked outer membrane protein [Mariniphaga sediminis]